MKIRDGDVFRWQYKDDEAYRAKHIGSGTAYWCLDQQCFATERSGVIYLIDTYWTDYGAEYLGSETSYVNPDKVDLEFLCNLKHIEFINEYDVQDYDKVYNLNRQKNCYKKYAIDKGAQASKAAILKKLMNERENLIRERTYSDWRLTQLEKEIKELE